MCATHRSEGGGRGRTAAHGIHHHNNLAWSPRSACDLYRRSWDIEVFFKQVKQPQARQLSRAQRQRGALAGLDGATGVCIAALHGASVRMGSHLHELFAVTRSELWERLDLLTLFKSYGTTSGRTRVIGALNNTRLP
jgi:hypothetical protein